VRYTTCLGAADAPAVGHPAAEVITAADDHGDLDAEAVHGKYLIGDAGEARGVSPGPCIAGQGLAAELDHYSAVPRQGQGSLRPVLSARHGISPRVQRGHRPAHAN